MDALPDIPAAPGPAEGPRGKLATNIVHFARTLRTAGLRVGPGQVLRAIEAVEAAGLRKRDDFYWTLHSVFVNRRDQREIFDQAFHVYWRNPRLLEKMMEMLLPQVGVPAERGPEQAAQPAPAGGAAAGPGRSAGRQGRAARSRGRGDLHRLRPRGAAASRLRADVAGRDRRRPARHFAAAPAGAAAAHPPLPLGAPRPPGRLPRLAAPGAQARGADRAAQARAAPPAAAARHPVRHLGLDGPLHAHVPAFHARHHQRPRPRLLLHLRHAAQQRDPLAAQQGRRRRPAEGVGPGRGLVGRHAHRPDPARVQQQVVAPGAGAGRRRAADHRRARSRGRIGPGRGNGAAAQVLCTADLAQPALAVWRLRAQISGQPGYAAPCR